MRETRGREVAMGKKATYRNLIVLWRRMDDL
jgi:hypothetical protein